MATSLLCLQDLAAAAAASAEGLSCVHLVKSECSYYHYLCDGVDDRVSVRVACSACVHVRDDSRVDVSFYFRGVVW